MGVNNQLSVCFPGLVDQWCTERNGDLRPVDVTYGSIRKVWWTCPVGHTWHASPNDRTNRERGCPVCAGHSVLAGFNDLATLRPDLIQDWHPTANGDLTPSGVTTGSTLRVWWQCHTCGFEWDTKINARALSDTGCRQCAGTIPVEGINTLEVACPSAAAMWVPHLNEGLQARQIHAGTNTEYWWTCAQGHVWRAPVSRVVTAHQHQPPSHDLSTIGCATCSKFHNQHTAPRGSVAQEYPHLVTEWDMTLNDPLVTPDTTTAGSDRKIWWICAQGHSWQAVVKSRCSKGYGCPYCSNRRVLVGYNDLATVDPLLAACWHPTLNNELTPRMVTARSSKSAYWLCPAGHTSRAPISAKVSTSLATPTTLACAECANQRHHRAGTGHKSRPIQ